MNDSSRTASPAPTDAPRHLWRLRPTKSAPGPWLTQNDQPYLERGADHIGSYQVLASFPSPDDRNS